MDYSIIIPAYNEALFLPDTLAALSAAMSEVSSSGELIVVDNNSSDETAAIAGAHGARVIFEPINQISRARNAGAAAAEGRYLIFVDADTSVNGVLLNAAIAALDSGKVCGGGAHLVIEHSNHLVRGTAVVWNLIAQTMKLAAGCFFFCRRDAFESVGGFSEKVYASEEIWLSLALRRWSGGRECDFVILDDRVISSARKVEWMSGAAIAKQALLLLVFPFSVRIKRCCGAWYRRP